MSWYSIVILKILASDALETLWTFREFDIEKERDSEKTEKARGVRGAHGKIGSMRERWRPLRDARKKTRTVPRTWVLWKTWKNDKIRCVNTRETRLVVKRTARSLTRVKSRLDRGSVDEFVYDKRQREKKLSLMVFGCRRLSPSPSPSRF